MKFNIRLTFLFLHLMGPEGSNLQLCSIKFQRYPHLRLLEITGDYCRILEITEITAEYWRLLETTGNYWINLGLDEAKRDVCDRNTTLLKNKNLKESTSNTCRVGLCTELFYAMIPTLFLCFLLICYPYILLHF